MVAKRVKLGDWWVEVECNKLYLFTSETALDPWDILYQDGWHHD